MLTFDNTRERRFGGGLVRALRPYIVTRRAAMLGGRMGHFRAAASAGGARHSARTIEAVNEVARDFDL